MNIIDRPPKPEAVQQVLYKLKARFPAAFGSPRPLCVGIYATCVCALWPSNCGRQNSAYMAYGKALAEALRQWCEQPAYLAACFANAPRCDLAGEPCGIVTATEAEWAALRLSQIRAVDQ